MTRRRTLGVAYAHEGLKSTLAASAKKPTSRLEKRRKSFKQLDHRFYREERSSIEGEIRRLNKPSRRSYKSWR